MQLIMIEYIPKYYLRKGRVKPVGYKMDVMTFMPLSSHYQLRIYLSSMETIESDNNDNLSNNS